MIVRPGRTVEVVLAVSSVPAGFPKVSRNGAPFVGASNSAVDLGDGFWKVVLTSAETRTPGTLFIAFAPGVGTSIQVKDEVLELSGSMRALLQNTVERNIQTSLKKADARNTGLLNDLFSEISDLKRGQ